jgi:IclR family pca regulon transcriptional regulator
VNEGGLVKSATRVLDLLELLGASNEALGAADIARKMSIPRSSAHMLLLTLEARHYVVADDSRRFRLNPLFAGGSRPWVGGFRVPLVQLGKIEMQDLVKNTGETSFLAALSDDHHIEYIEKVLSPQEVRCDADLFVPRAIYSNSPGLVLLAYRSSEEIDRYFEGVVLAKITAQTITSREQLNKDLAKIRKQGYATTSDTNTIGVSGVSAPVFLGEQRAVAALNISVPTARFAACADKAREAVVKAAQKLSKELTRAHAPAGQRVPG